MSELYGFKKNLEKVQVRSKAESVAKSHLVPTLIDETPLAAPATKHEYARRTIPELANWNVVVLKCKCGNIEQNIIYFRDANTGNYLIDALTSTVTRGVYLVHWATKSIMVKWVDGRSDLAPAFVQILAVYGLVQNADVVDTDTEDDPSGDEGEDIDITALTEEVLGIRIGADGTIYENAGQAVREQYNKLAEMIDNLDIDTISQNVNDLIADVNAAVATAIEQIETAGGLILDPTLTQSGQAADAKVVGDKIGPVLSEISWIEGQRIITYPTPYASASSNVDWRYFKIACEEGDRFQINAVTDSANNYRAWTFVDSDNNLLTYASASESYSGTILAPENAAYLIVNDKNSGSICYKGDNIGNELNKLKFTLGDTYSLIPWETSKRIVSYPDPYETSGSNVDWNCFRISCAAGDRFLINAVTDSNYNYRAWAFATSNNELISACDAVAGYNGVVTAPEGAAWLLVNDKKSGGICYKGKTVSQNISVLNDFVGNIITDIVWTEGQRIITYPTPYTSAGSNADWRYFKIACSQGDRFQINAVTDSAYNYRAWTFIDADNNLLTYAAQNASHSETVIAPKDSAYLIVNDKNSGNNCYKGIPVKTDLDAINSDLITKDYRISYLYPFTSLSMFFNIGVVGDSFASGGFSVDDVSGGGYSYSWIQNLARRNGITAQNFSEAGLNTATWLTSSKGLTKLLSEPAQDLYIIALGINDVYKINDESMAQGTTADIKEDYTQNPSSFYGNMGRIVGNIKTHAPNSKIVFCSIMSAYQPTITQMDPLIKEIADFMSIPFIQCRDDEFFTSSYYKSNMSESHPVAMTYAGMGIAMERLLINCIVNNSEYFKTYGLTTN